MTRSLSWLRTADSAWFFLLLLVSPAFILLIASLLFLSCLALSAAWPNEYAILAGTTALGLLLGLGYGWGLTCFHPTRRGGLLLRILFSVLAGALGAKGALNFSLGWVPHQMRPAMLAGLSSMRDGVKETPALWPMPKGARFHAVPHATTKDVQQYPGDVCAQQGALDTTRLRDTGKWGYVGDDKSPCPGRVFIDCTHTDSKGVLWASY